VTASVYITALEADSGKSLVALGVMELLTRESDRVGYFRPVVRAGEPDATIELFRSRYRLSQSYEESYGVTTDQTRALGEPQQAVPILDTILHRFEALARTVDVVLVEGTDYTGASAAFELELNMDVAMNLGAPLLVVDSAHGHRPDQVAGALAMAQAAIAGRHGTALGYIVNRVEFDQREALLAALPDVSAPVWVLPEDPLLGRPTMRAVMAATGSRLINVRDADEETEVLAREVAAVRVAAMNVPRFLDHLQPDTLVIAPGDRADIVVATAAVRHSETYPRIAGLLLTAGLEPDPSVMRLIDGMERSAVPMLLSEDDTYSTATKVGSIRPQITADDVRKIERALRLFDEHVDTDALTERLDVVSSTTVTPLMFEHRLIERSRKDLQHIVLPEGSDDRVLQAADHVLRRGISNLTILGEVEVVRERARILGLDLSEATVIDPHTSALRETFADELAEIRSHKGLTREGAFDLVSDASYFGTMLVHRGLVDGMVSGAAHTTAHTIRPALQIIKTAPGIRTVSSAFFMALSDRVLVFADAAVVTNPTVEQLADIAISSAHTAAQLGIDPRVAMLSYSTGDSGFGADVEKVRAATALVREREPQLLVAGPIQYDAAVEPSVGASKLPGSDVAGRATVLIFPDLNTGNNTYKAVQRSAGALAIGPVLQGLAKPVNDLSRGATVADIVNTIAITAIQAQVVV
jgi:phosphate acetyltransferase